MQKHQLEPKNADLKLSETQSISVKNSRVSFFTKQRLKRPDACFEKTNFAHLKIYVSGQ